MRLLTPYWNTRKLSSDMFGDIDQLFDRMTSEQSYDERNFTPACEIAESDDYYLMSVDVPGMKKEDIKIDVTDNILTLSGERKRESSASDKHKVQRFEKSYGFFSRSFTLPTIVESGKVEASYEDGVLEIFLPKSQKAKPRQVEIQSGKKGFFEKADAPTAAPTEE